MSVGNQFSYDFIMKEKNTSYYPESNENDNSNSAITEKYFISNKDSYNINKSNNKGFNDSNVIKLYLRI